MNCCVFWQSKFLLGSKLVASGHVANPYTKIYVHLVPWVLVIGGGCKTVLSVCFKGAFLLMHNSRRKTGDNVFLLERICMCVNLRSMYMYHVCLHLLSGDIYVLHSYRV